MVHYGSVSWIPIIGRYDIINIVTVEDLSISLCQSQKCSWQQRQVINGFFKGLASLRILFFFPHLMWCDVKKLGMESLTPQVVYRPNNNPWIGTLIPYA